MGFLGTGIVGFFCFRTKNIDDGVFLIFALLGGSIAFYREYSAMLRARWVRAIRRKLEVHDS